jgi:ABC-type branched-subunit amino acid transport system ATPase component/ABC-type branched-subunit amino acid transport system permease subunit
MSAAWQFYIITLAVYFGINLIAGWSLNLQYGVAGIQNFAFIVFQSIGAYVAGITTIGSTSSAYGERIIFGASLPWPVPLLLAGLSGAVLAAVVGTFALRPMSKDLQAIVMIMVSVIATSIVESQGGLLNGSQGIAGVPKPFGGVLGLGLVKYGWFFVGLTAAFCLLTFFVIHRITSSPYGRTLRAIRENHTSAETLAVPVRKETMMVFILGGAIAAVSGALFVEFVGAWSPAAWGIYETFLFLVALTIGGIGNNAGVTLGIAVVLTGILDGVNYLPNFGTGSLSGALQLMGVGILIVVFLWFRPQGILPERRRIIGASSESLIAAEYDSSARRWGSRRSPQALRTAAVEETPDLESTETELAPVMAVNGPRPTEQLSTREALILTGVTKGFDGLKAVVGVTITICEGTAVGLIGPNGAGKSTLINLIAGLEHPDAGSIVYDGNDISRLAPHRIASMGLVRTFQLSSEFQRMTVMENLLVASRSQRGNTMGQALLGKRRWVAKDAENIEKARTLLHRFKLSRLADDYAGELSGGQKRLLEIARALMADPRFLVLDEPLAGVAPGLREEVEGHLVTLRDGGMTLLMCEHDLGTVERCTDKVVVMDLGRVLAAGTMADIRQNEEVIDAYLVS